MDRLGVWTSTNDGWVKVMAAPILVPHVRRPHDDVVAYILRRASETRKLMLYRTAPISAAAAMNQRDVPLALLFSVDPLEGQTELRVLVHFAKKPASRLDSLTASILEPTFIRNLRLPTAQRTPHWKNGREFALTRKASNTLDVDAKPVGPGVISKDTLQDWFCEPSLEIKLNSATNACFRTLCDYIKCAKQKRPCLAEEQKVRAFCLAVG